MSTLSTTPDVIAVLGGVHDVASLTGRSVSAVYNWVYRQPKRFPAETFLILTTELTRLGHSAPASLWGIEEPKRPEVSQ